MLCIAVYQLCIFIHSLLSKEYSFAYNLIVLRLFSSHTCNGCRIALGAAVVGVAQAALVSLLGDSLPRNQLSHSIAIHLRGYVVVWWSQ